MVFHSISKSETTPPATKNANQQQQQQQQPLQQQQQHHNQMASSTMKPLHNFSLPDLKWAMNHTSNQRVRKPADPTQKSPQRDSGSDSDTRKGNLNQSEAVKNGNSGSSSDRKIEKSEKKVSGAASASASAGAGAGAAGAAAAAIGDHAVENLEKKSTASDGGRSKILFRFRTKNSKSVEEVGDAGDQALLAEDADELMHKTWNLRPRKAVTKGPNPNGGAAKTGGGPGQESKPHANSSRPELTRSRNSVDAKLVAEKKEKEKEKKSRFSIPLSKEEIEEDIFIMTGSKPARRPKKRVKNVQKQLDNVFPGMWLSSITPDSYRVHDTSKAPAKLI